MTGQQKEFFRRARISLSAIGSMVEAIDNKADWTKRQEKMFNRVEDVGCALNRLEASLQVRGES